MDIAFHGKVLEEARPACLAGRQKNPTHLLRIYFFINSLLVFPVGANATTREGSMEGTDSFMT